MVEAHTRSAAIEDVDEDTFSLFCEFAYTGDYHPPPFEVKMSEHDEIVPLGRDPSGKKKGKGKKSSSREVSTLWGYNVPGPETDYAASVVEEAVAEVSIEYQPSKRATVRKSFEERAYSVVQSRELMVDSCKPIANSDPNQNFLPVFLGHAKLYVLAEKYGVGPLKALALQKLHQTLLTFTLYGKIIPDIIELIRFAYSDENTMDREDDPDELRGLVLHYVVSEIDTIAEKSEFYGLIEEGGAFVRDFWRMVKKDLL
jgi:hypothetical protein